VLERAASKAAAEARRRRPLTVLSSAVDRAGGAFLDLDVFALRDLVPWLRVSVA